MNSKHFIRISLGVTLFVSGCGKTAPQPENVVSEQQSSAVPPVIVETEETSPTVQPIVAESTSDQTHSNSTQKSNSVTPPKRASAMTPLDMLARVSLLRSAPIDRVLQPGAVEATDETVVALTPEQIVVERERRLREILPLAHAVIVATKSDPEQLKIFNSAVDALCDARLQLAIQGDAEQATLLEADANTFYENDPESFAAVESASRLLQFVQARAQQHGTEDPQWIVAYAQQSKLFVAKFPKESSRSAIHLIAAGRLCDQAGKFELATSCLTIVETEFPNTPYALQVEGILRRLRLKGELLTEFAGSTLSGQHLSINSYRGAPVLVTFWASNSEQFQSDLKQLESTQQRLSGRFQMIGVNLDRDDLSAKRFAEFSNLKWENLFSSDRNKRGVNNPVASYYGVTQIPSYWLIDASGKVISTNVNIDHLEPTISSLLQTPPGSTTIGLSNSETPQ